MFLASKDAGYGKVVLFSDGEYAFASYDSGYNVGYVPDPLIGSPRNSRYEFRSRSFGYCNVDWGDGTKESIPLTKVRGQNDYRIIFRVLDIEYLKNPDNHPWWFYKEDGTEYIPVPNHHYTDGYTGLRPIILEFTSDIYYFFTNRISIKSFPVLDSPSLESVTLNFLGDNAADIPNDRIARSVNITELVIEEGNHLIKKIPESWSKLVNLKSISLSNSGDFYDDVNSNIRKIPEFFPNLTRLGLSGCYVRTYPREWLSLSKITRLDVESRYEDSSLGHNPPYDPDAMIQMDEIESINSTLTAFNHMGDWYCPGQKSWHEQMNGKGLDNISYMNFRSARSLPFDNLPQYVFEMRRLVSMSTPQSTPTVERADDFVDMMYRGTVEWEYSTMSSVASDGKRNQFYGLSVTMYLSAFPYNTSRPSGIYQAPSGFVKGSSNGSPSTSMEKIYVLQNNYAQKWTVKPED